MTYRQYQQYIIAIELYVNFEEIVTKAGCDCQHYNQAIQSSYPARRPKDTVPSLYSVSYVIFN